MVAIPRESAPQDASCATSDCRDLLRWIELCDLDRLHAERTQADCSFHRSACVDECARLPRATVSWPYSTDRGVITVAQKVQVILTDDLDGGEAEETVQFAIDGVSYEIDLSAANAEALREAVAAYVEAGRRVGGRSTRRAAAAPKERPAAERADLTDVRAWARENGFQVSDRGRVSGEIRAAYEAAH